MQLASLSHFQRDDAQRFGAQWEMGVSGSGVLTEQLRAAAQGSAERWVLL